MPQDWKDYFNDPALGLDRRRAGQQPRPARGGPCASRKRARCTVQRADRLPSVDGTAGYSRSRASDPGPSRDAISQQYRAGVGITAFELDFFGRIKSLTDAALERYLPAPRRTSRRRAVAGGRNRHGLFQRAFAGRAAAADPQHAGIARDHTDADPAPLRRRPGNRHGPAHRADAGGIVAPRWPNSAASTARPCMRWACWRVIFAAARRRPDAVGKPEPYPAGGRPAVGAADAASGSRARRNTLKAANADIGAARAAFSRRCSWDHGHRQHRQQLRTCSAGQRRLGHLRPS